VKIKLLFVLICCILTCSIIPSSAIGDDNQFSSSARFYISLPAINGANTLYTNSQGYYLYGYYTNSYTENDEYVIINTFCERQSFGTVSGVKEGMTVKIPKRIAPLIQEINHQPYSENITSSDNVTNK
jgi:hypothetical protein